MISHDKNYARKSTIITDYIQINRVRILLFILLWLNLSICRSIEDPSSPPGSPNSLRSKPIAINPKPQGKQDEGSPRTGKEPSLMQQLFNVKLGALWDGKSTPPSPLMKTRESPLSLSPQSIDSVSTIELSVSPDSSSCRPKTPPCALPLIPSALNSSSLLESPRSPVSTPPQSSRSSTPQRATPRSLRELEEAEKVRDITPRRKESSSRKESPRNIKSLLQVILPPALEASLIQAEEHNSIVQDINTQILSEFANMKEIPQTLKPALHMLRFYFFRLNELSQTGGIHVVERDQISIKAQNCLNILLNVLFEVHKMKPTYEMILNEFWRMTITSLLNDHLNVINNEALSLIAQSISFLAQYQEHQNEQRIFYHKAAEIYVTLATRKKGLLFTDISPWLEAARMFHKAGKVEQLFTWDNGILKDVINQTETAPTQSNYIIAAHCYLALHYQELHRENKIKHHLHAAQKFYHAKAYWECFELMRNLSSYCHNQWVKEKYKEVQDHVFTIQKSKWDLCFLVTSLIQFALSHADQSDFPTKTNEWISEKPQAEKLRKWYQVIKTRSDEWLLDRKLKLFIFSTSISGGHPPILNCTDSQFDEWLEDLLEINRS